MTFSLVGCAVERPNTDLCIVNAPNGVRKCYNMARDYDANGALVPSAKAVYRANKTVADLNKFLVVDSATGPEDGLAALKAYIKKLRDHFANCEAGNQ